MGPSTRYDFVRRCIEKDKRLTEERTKAQATATYVRVKKGRKCASRPFDLFVLFVLLVLLFERGFLRTCRDFRLNRPRDSSREER